MPWKNSGFSSQRNHVLGRGVDEGMDTQHRTGHHTYSYVTAWDQVLPFIVQWEQERPSCSGVCTAHLPASSSLRKSVSSGQQIDYPCVLLLVWVLVQTEPLYCWEGGDTGVHVQQCTRSLCSTMMRQHSPLLQVKREQILQVYFQKGSQFWNNPFTELTFHRDDSRLFYASFERQVSLTKCLTWQINLTMYFVPLMLLSGGPKHSPWPYSDPQLGLEQLLVDRPLAARSCCSSSSGDSKYLVLSSHSSSVLLILSLR